MAKYGAYSSGEVYTAADVQHIVAYAGAVSVENMHGYNCSLIVREVLMFSWYGSQKLLLQRDLLMSY